MTIRERQKVYWEEMIMTGRRPGDILPAHDIDTLLRLIDEMKDWLVLNHEEGTCGGCMRNDCITKKLVDQWQDKVGK